MLRNAVPRHWWLRTGALTLAAGALMAGAALAATPATNVATPTVVKFAPGLTVGSLAGRPDTDLVEFSGGRHVSVGQLRRLEAAAQKMRAPNVDKMPAAFKVGPLDSGAVKLRINSGADIAAALQPGRPDTDVVQLPSGRLTTVGQIRFLQPSIEKKVGYKLTALPQRPNLSGPATHISGTTTKSDWKNILQSKPDSAVLESPNGHRITVGELKQYMAQHTKPKQSRPGVAKPSATPQPAPARRAK